MAVIPNGYAQLNWIFAGIGVPTGAQFTMGMDVQEFAGTPLDLAIVAFGAWNTELRPTTSSAVSLVGVLCKFGPDATGPSALNSGNAPGTSAGVPASPAVAYLVQKNTSFGGRSGRGRFYLPGVTENNVDSGGVVDPTGRATIQSNLNDFYNLLSAGDVGPVLLHGAGAPLAIPTPIDSFTIDSRVATQRRRQRR